MLKGIEGGRVYVGVSQTPCEDNCTPLMQEFAQRTGLGLTVVSATREKLNKPGEFVTPRTALRTLGRPGVPEVQPLEFTELSFAPRAPTRPSGLGGGGGGGPSGGGPGGITTALTPSPPTTVNPMPPPTTTAPQQGSVFAGTGTPSTLPEPATGISPGPQAAALAGVQAMQGLAQVSSQMQEEEAQAALQKILPEIRAVLGNPALAGADPRMRPQGVLVGAVFMRQSAPFTMQGASSFLWVDYVAASSKGEAQRRWGEIMSGHGGPGPAGIKDLAIPEIRFSWISPDGKVETWTQQLVARVEPTPGAGKPCFIATACYGSAMASEVELLRSFRDRVLAERPGGRAFIALYYRTSPPLARFLERHERCRALVRELFLRPIVAVVGKAMPRD
jgi:hypothetical protein